MDGLALLCNLHADGPTTLRRLREAGVASLEDLLRRPEPQVASLLRAPLPFVQRLQHEGRVLLRRMRSAALDSELLPARPAPRELPTRLVVRPAAQAFEPDDDVPPPVVPPLPRVEVAEAGPGPDAALAPPPSLGAHSNDLRDARLDAGAAPSAVALEPTAALRAGELPGLDRRLLERLVHEGVRTYGALADLCGLTLARRAGIAYPRLLELGLAARRLLRGSARSAPPPPEVAATASGAEPVVVLRPFAPPARSVEPAEPVELDEPPPAPVQRSADPGVAGPFV